MNTTRIDLAFAWDGLELAGSLHLPTGDGPHAAVIMAQGSGPADRNSGGYFEPIRQAFLDRGMAAFSFDKPGCGQSTGDWRNYGLVGRAEQLIAAVELVRNHPAVTAERVGIWGQSQGGWLVQQLAGQIDGLAFAIANSAPTLSVQDQIRYDIEQAVRGHGHSASEIQDALNLTTALHNAAVRDADFDTISEELLAPASLQPWFGSYPTIEDAGDWHLTKLLIVEPHDPVSDIKQTKCPFLAVYGALDVLLPAWRGAEESGQALTEAVTTDTAVVVFPNGDHRIQTGDGQDFVDGYLNVVGDWAAKRAC